MSMQFSLPPNAIKMSSINAIEAGGENGDDKMIKPAASWGKTKESKNKIIRLKTSMS